jgi:hypothetical protein
MTPADTAIEAARKILLFKEANRDIAAPRHVHAPAAMVSPNARPAPCVEFCPIHYISLHA